MFDNTPNARQLAKLMADARHQYSSPEEIAKAYEQKSGYSCTPEQIESILEWSSTIKPHTLVNNEKDKE